MPGEALLGTTLGAYRIKQAIGSGATGVVYSAEEARSGRPVALKVLHENLGSISGLERRFSREARVLKKLSHPYIVEVFDFGVEDGRTFIAMELLEGGTLEEVLARGPIPPARAIAIYDPLLAALAEAHDHEVVHRDLKPANVFLTRNGGVKILDFGLAKMLSADEVRHDGTLTRNGRIVGTPAYMAPEQITGVSMDVRADVYAAGVMLYELLADRRPFVYERRSDLLRAHLLEQAPPMTRVRPGLWVHPALDALVSKALAKNPAERFANGRAMLEALRALPADCARVDASARARRHARSRSSSAVISGRERAAITESASLSIEARASATDVGTPPSIAGTAGLFALALVLLGTAAALWITLMMESA